MEIQEYFDIVAKSKKEFDNWIKHENISYKCLQFIFPFVETNKEIATWIFVLENKDVENYKLDGTYEKMQNKFKEILKQNNLPKKVIKAMIFEIDSHENVKNNYEGSYFYRLR